jgi:hypothetical protein
MYLPLSKFTNTALLTALKMPNRYLPLYKTAVATLYQGFYSLINYVYPPSIWYTNVISTTVSIRCHLSIETERHKPSHATSYNISIKYFPPFYNGLSLFYKRVEFKICCVKREINNYLFGGFVCRNFKPLEDITKFM